MNSLVYENGNKIIFHPGYYIQDYIEEGFYTIEDFAEGLEVSRQTILQIIDGEMDITTDLANKLAEMLNISANVWLDLQRDFNSVSAKMDLSVKAGQNVELIPAGK
ncbi:MAG: HigA family addiction module antidote protein [Fusobacteriaceae bacterium]|jgi:addiction module HigA family antidote|nr:HigA family addiction module antidote protein [Fusobacteriaceae bacterium]